MSKEIKRKCQSCTKLINRDELIKITKLQNGLLKINPNSNELGRSVYVCKNSECIEKAFKKGRIAGLLKVKNIENLKELLQRNLIN